MAFLLPCVIKQGSERGDTLPGVMVHPWWQAAEIYSWGSLEHRRKSWGVPSASEPLEGKAEAVINPKASRECCWGSKAPPPQGGIAASPLAEH